MQRDPQTLVDLRDACQLIRQFIAGVDEAAFSQNVEKQSAVLHQLMVIGEGVKRLSEEFRDAHLQIPWRDVARMRDKLIHHYDVVDLKLVWVSVSRDIPVLLAFTG